MKQSKFTVPMLIFQLILTVAGLVGEVLTVINGISGATVSFWVANAFIVAVYIFSLFYFLVGYKKAHGNAMRYIMIVFSLSLGFSSANIGAETIIGTYILIICAVTVAYISGRLDKIDINKTLISIVAVLLFVRCLVAAFVPASLIGYLSGTGASTAEISAAARFSPYNQLIQFGSLSIGYLIRFKAHAEAGK